MDKKLEYAVIIGLTILLVLLLFKKNEVIYLQGKQSVIRDTILKDSIKIKERIKFRTEPILIYERTKDTLLINDSIAIVPKFIAKKDTIIEDTYRFAYSYPTNRFDVEIGRRADTTRTLIIKEKQATEEPFYNSLLFKVSTFFVGIISGLIIK